MSDTAPTPRSAILIDALIAAASAMGAASSLGEVFSAASVELSVRGFSSILLVVEDEGASLRPRYMSHDAKALTAAERLLGMKHSRFSLSIDRLRGHEVVIGERRAIFVSDTADLARSALAPSADTLVRRLISLLGMEMTILAPVVVDGAVTGVFALQAGQLSDEDVPPVMAFAHQLASAWQRTLLAGEIGRRHERFQQMFENMRNGVAIYEAVDGGSDFVFTEFNGAAAWAGSVTRDEAIGRRVTEVFPGVESLGLLELLRKVWRTGEPAHQPPSRYRDERMTIWVENHVFRLPSGEVVAMFEDVTESQEVLAALRESEERFRAIAEHMSDVLFVTDSRGLLEYISPVARELFGYEPAEMCGRHFAELLAPSSLETALAAFAEAVNAGIPTRDLELDMRHADGSIFSGELSGSLFQTREFAGTAGTIRDITERKRLAAEATRFSRIVEESVNEIYLFEPGSLRFVDANRAAESNTGYSLVELREMTPLDLKPDLDAVIFGEMIEPVRDRTEERIVFETFHRRKDGSRYPVEVHLQLLSVDESELFAAVILDTTQRKRAEMELQIASRAIEHSDLGVIRLDRDGRICQVNQYACDLLEYGQEELLRMTAFDVTVGLDPEMWTKRWEELVDAGPVTFEKEYRTKTGRIIPVEISSSIIEFEGIVYDHGFVRDISDRKAAEIALRERDEQLLQSQKMESIGRLAGGVAHDYNNMLGVILGHADLALAEMEPSHRLYGDIQEIRKAAQRSADLTRQLLAFARKQTARPRVIVLDDEISDLMKMLRRLIKEDIEVEWNPGDASWRVSIDPVQVSQILTNLCLNAQDALPLGGHIRISTENIAFGESGALAHPLAGAGGDYVRLSVSDDGSGMDPETLEHIFEPFFTTKIGERGIGLGLATVYGIAGQNGGFVEARSEPGMGAVIEVYLPRSQGEVEVEAPAAVREAAGRAEETILIVEDERAILTMAERALRRLGYSVLAAGDPAEAILLEETHTGAIDLLLTDMVMPGMSGEELARKIKELRPGMACLFMSGYAADSVARIGSICDVSRFIQKPFTVSALEAKVRETLDSRGGANQGGR